MTMISRLGFNPKKQNTLISRLLTSTNEIAIIIPVKNNQQGIDTFIKMFFQTHPEKNYPGEIIIVDNNSKPEIKLPCKTYPIPVTLLKCAKPGPGNARNLGVKHCKTDWILFTDSDCIPTETTLTGYLDSQNGSLGYAGNIKAAGNDIISKYYDQQEILIPPKVDELNLIRPDYIITANCLIWKTAFERVGGFNENITRAAGEDIDIGFKLLNAGNLGYAFKSVVKHNFDGGLKKFRERFMRYGQGNKVISTLYNLDLRPKPFKPNKKTLINYSLALLQYYWLLKGYKKSNL